MWKHVYPPVIIIVKLAPSKEGGRYVNISLTAGRRRLFSHLVGVAETAECLRDSLEGLVSSSSRILVGVELQSKLVVI